jgi:hypothetical protein
MQFPRMAVALVAVVVGRLSLATSLGYLPHRGLGVASVDWHSRRCCCIWDSVHWDLAFRSRKRRILQRK